MRLVDRRPRDQPTGETRAGHDVCVTMLRVSAGGEELGTLAESLPGSCRVLGIAGPPGAGKSTLAAALVRLLGARAAAVPMDGFHLADVELVRRGLLQRKGAHETFDAWGYAALLERVRARPSYTVYAPGFARDLEQPVAAAIAVEPDAEVVVTEGNYLLLDRPEWRRVRSQLDAVWYVSVEEPLRRQRLLARHMAFGKSAAAAAAWVERVDEPNARLVARTRRRADLEVELSAWTSPSAR
jgi:pantothenate kinase